MPDTISAFKIPTAATINRDGEGCCRNTLINPSYELGRYRESLESAYDEIPFDSIEGFSEINL